jgi:glucose/mannose-6-phosphate isomerase
MGALDRPEALAVDSLGLILGAGEAVQAFDRGRASAEALEIPFPRDAIRDVAICGMGGSAIAGDLIAGVYRDRLRRPVATVRDYILPGWVGPDTLVVLCSYSGNTEETLTCTMQALERKSLIVGITSNGKLADLGGREGMPIISVPPGMQPRAALLDLFTPMLVTLGRLGILPQIDGELDDGRAALEAAVAAYGPRAPEAENPAKLLATALAGSVPVVYGAEATAALAYRWKCQFNENAELPAFASVLPELSHNEVVGWAAAGALGRFSYVSLEDPEAHPRNVLRAELVAEIAAAGAAPVVRVTARGSSPVERLVSLILLGDLVTIYAAVLRGADPVDIPALDSLKAAMTSVV